MTREEITYKFLESKASNYILQLPTSYGKTRLALQKIEQWYTSDCHILIAIPINALIDNWKNEIRKWKYDKMLPNITFTTYYSLHKHVDVEWDIVILDEAHHTSERCQNILRCMKIKHLLGLSATLKREHLGYFNRKFKPEIIKVGIKDAIESDVLPDPKIILIPLVLDNKNITCAIEKNIKKTTKAKNIKTIRYAEKWSNKEYKGPLRILCTALQYYNDFSNLVEWYKQKGMYDPIMRKIWLHKAGERLKWLAQQKEAVIKQLLKQLKSYRVLTFCQSIKQSESLGCPCVNSKVGLENLEKFNNRKIKHIAAVEMLDEGANLVECKIGLFQMINSSQRMSIQRIGRILRHKEPVLIFPYWVNTREQEIIEDLIKGYNPKLIQIKSITDIKEPL